MNISKDNPVKSTISESIRHLAKSYYPYIYSDTHNISRPVVDLQAAFEICSESLEEFERIHNEMSSLGYAIYGLEQALFRALTELTVIREEVVDLMNALRTSEKFNLRLLDQLALIEGNIQNGIESSKSLLSMSKSPLSTVSMTADHYMIPRSTRETLEAIIELGKPGCYSTVGADNLLKEKLSPDMARMNWLIQIQKELAHRHAEFSFLVISLWSEQVRDNFHLVSRKSRLLPGGAKTSYDRHKSKIDNEENTLRMASAAKIEDLPGVIQSISGRVLEMGGIIVEELNKLRASFEETRLQHKTLNTELAERRRQLIDCLLATHSAVQTLLDLDERNDALVGKLVKTRPLFADLYRLIQTGTLNEECKTTLSLQNLAEVLGPVNWRNLVDQLGNLPVVTGNERTKDY